MTTVLPSESAYVRQREADSAKMFVRTWDESKHPRHSKGERDGGKFSAGSGPDRSQELADGARLTIPASHTYGDIPVEVKRSGEYVTFMSDPGGLREDRLITLTEDEARSFLSDLRGEIPQSPTSGNEILDAAIAGKAQYLGRGQGGIAFDAGDRIIKAASIVPYHWNHGLRTQDQANAKLQSEIDIVNELQAAGMPNLMPLTPVMHEGRLFAIREKVSLDGLDQQAIDDAGAALEKMHAAGYIMQDQVQIGMGNDGKVRFFDVGEAKKADTNSIFALQDQRDDHSSLSRVAEKAGLKHISPESRNPVPKWEAAYEKAHLALAGTDTMALFDARMGLRRQFDSMRASEPDMADFYHDGHKEMLEMINARHDELKAESTLTKSYSPVSKPAASAFFARAAHDWDETKHVRHAKGDERGGEFAQKGDLSKAILHTEASAFFARAASDCGANTDGGHGFQPGNTCGADGDSSGSGTATQASPKTTGRKLREAFYGTKKDHADVLAKVEPTYQGKRDASDPERAKALKEIMATPEERAQHTEVVKQTLSKLPPMMSDVIARNVTDIKLAGTVEWVGRLANKGGSHKGIYGFYRPVTGELVLNGGPPADSKHPDDKGLTQHGIYAHEMAHAADIIGNGKTFSESNDWKAAYAAEINLDHVPLSNYARTNAQEGFAEFVRLMATDLAKTKQKYPKCAKAVQSAYGSF